MKKDFLKSKHGNEKKNTSEEDLSDPNTYGFLIGFSCSFPSTVSVTPVTTILKSFAEALSGTVGGRVSQVGSG
jgi:hypothetical protein